MGNAKHFGQELVLRMHHVPDADLRKLPLRLVRTRGRGYRDTVGEGVNGNEKKPRGIDGIDHIACEQIFRGAGEPGRKQYRVRAIGVQGACGSVGDRGIS